MRLSSDSKETIRELNHVIEISQTFIDMLQAGEEDVNDIEEIGEMVQAAEAAAEYII